MDIRILISSAMFPTISLTGLAPSTQYFYVCGDPSLGEMSEEYSFTTLPLPSPASYPSRVAIVGDIGLTYNSSATLDHIKLNDPSMLLVIGDLSYANNYLTTGESAACYSCSFPTAPTRETYQPHWDNWGRYSFYSGLALAQFFGGFCTLKIVGVVMHILT
jgi:phosphodiesterase/alkaline phosphatase D-like protein